MLQVLRHKESLVMVPGTGGHSMKQLGEPNETQPTIGMSYPFLKHLSRNCWC